MGTHAIKDEHVRFIKGVVALLRPDARLYFFGSRAEGTARPASDLDLVLKEEKEIPSSDILDIKELMKASRLPFSVDVIDWCALSEGFQNAIKDSLKEF